MSKMWYPMISNEICEECGTCVERCPHGVYDLKKSPVPIVIDGDSCYEGCHGCGNRCPVGAITYASDDTGWIPPNGKESDSKTCGCGSECICASDCACN